MTEDDDISIERRLHLQKVQEAWTVFMKSPAYPFYVSARQEEIDRTKSDIVSMDPIERKDEIESYKMRGDLRTTESFLTLFEDVAVSLANRIDEMLETEQPNSEQQ